MPEAPLMVVKPMTARKQAPPPERMVIEVSRRVEVRCFHVLGELAFATRRDELRAVLLRMQELGGGIDAMTLCRDLLGGRPRAVGQRLLNVCALLGLVEWDANRRQASLTAEGRAAAGRDTVFVPERGTWTLYVARDPLLPGREAILAVEPFREPSARDEVLGPGQDEAPEDDEPEREPEPLPDWVQALRGLEHTPRWSKDGRMVRLMELEARGEPVLDAPASVDVTFRIAPGAAPRVRVDGKIDGIARSGDVAPPSVTFEEIWNGLPLAKLWREGALRKPFAQLDDGARENFETSEGVAELRRPELGAFGAFRVHHIPVLPADDADASRWATWLLERQARSYVTPADYARRCEALRTGRFQGFRLELPDQAALARSILARAKSGRPPAEYWHLRAPLDWAL